MPVSEQERLSLSFPDPFQDPAIAHRIFTRLRAEEPVAWCPEPWGGPGFWSITKYDDIQEISKLPKLFSSDGRHGGITLPDPAMIANRARELGRSDEPAAELSAFEGGRSMITMDPPEHNQHRRMVAPGFTPQTLDALVPRIRERARVILDGIGAQSHCEFVSSVAAELPIQMLAELFDVQQADRHKLFQWSNLIIGGEDPDLALPREQIIAAFMELAGYALKLYQERQAQPGNDLISMLVNTRLDGEPMSVPDYLSAFVLLVVAGNETTRNSISGGIQALSEYPAERQKLLDDPTLIPRAVDEIIRWVHPVIYMRRTALADYTLRGVTIRAGDKLALWYMSGNRDEEKWADPFTFNVTREGPRHLSFGYGQHLCIGWRLAELQLQVLFEELLARYPDIRVDGPVTRIRTNFLNSIKTMPVRYTPRSRAA
ncbi:MAG: cytochrome P450 [Pseudomonadales bacterium]|nr:cytochrome P450 [Pseudomonadales bacterium]